MALKRMLQVNQMPRVNSWNENVFEKCAEMLDLLPDSSAELGWKLLKGFVFFSSDAQRDLLWSAMDSYLKSLSVTQSAPLSGNEKITLLPIVNVEDDATGSPKSSHEAVNILKSAIGGFQEEYKWRIEPRNTLQGFPWSQLGPNFRVCLCDTFIGTGATLSGVLRMIRAENAVGLNYVQVVSSVVHKDALVNNEVMQVPISYSVTSLKALADLLGETDDNLRKLEDIGALLRIRRNMYFGYKNSQALIGESRTPNNTLPMFWCSLRRKGERWPCPFPRR